MSQSINPDENDLNEVENTSVPEEEKNESEELDQDSEPTEVEEASQEEAETEKSEETEQEPVREEVVKKSPEKKIEKKQDDFLDRDKVIKVDSLSTEDAYDIKMFEEMSQFYEQSLKEIREGEIVRGRIVSISGKEIAIDIGFKAEGTIDIDEFDDIDSLNIGDEINVFLDKVEDQEGQLVLSKRKADFLKTWEKMVQYFGDGTVIKGKITRRIKGGMVVDLNGIDAFLPGSQIDIHPVRDFDVLVGEEMDFRIVKINELRKNIVLSHKVLIEESLAEVREKILKDMDVGSVMEGTVKNITDFGVFVDLGGVDGLLHITDLSWGRISHPSEIVGLDDKITVKIIDFDPVRKRVSVGYKQLMPHPWEGVEERYPIGKKVIGKVVSITNYGAFIELEKGVEGLIHVSEMSWTQHIKHPSAMLSIGDEVEAVVLSMNVDERKISLGMKQIEPDPWETLEEKYSVNSRHKGVVRDLVPFGAFVELEDGIEGLVHISDLSWTRKVRHPGEIVKKGQEIEVIILGFDRNERRIALGHKQIQNSPWDVFESQYAVGAASVGKVVRLIDKGVIVELPMDVEGFVPNSQLGRDDEGSIRKRLSPGDELELIVVEFEKEAKRIVLSATEAKKKKEREDHKEHLKEEKQTAETKAETPEKVKEEKAKASDKNEKPAIEEPIPAEEPIVIEAKDSAEKPEEAAQPETETPAEEKSPKKAVTKKSSEDKKAEAKEEEKPAKPKKKTTKKTKKDESAENADNSVDENSEEDDSSDEIERPKKKTAKKTKKTDTEEE